MFLLQFARVCAPAVFAIALIAGSLLPGQAAEPLARWSSGYLKQPAEWYSSPTARAVAGSVISYQSPQGGWPKNTDLTVPPPNPNNVPPAAPSSINSLDNDATTLPMEFLARIVHATSEPKCRDSFLRGVDYLLAAQYPNGGWPQFFPLRGTAYYSRITFNDGAMIRVMTVLRDIAGGKPPYNFVDTERRTKAVAAVQRGVECILKTQVRQNGRLTVWCAQHDEKTLAPAWARAYEPPSLSGAESVGVVRFLMSIEKPTPGIVAAVDGAVNWLREVPIRGMRLETTRGADGREERRLIADRSAPPLWARFYELGTNRPLYLDRDSVFHYRFDEIGYERRSGYSYHGPWADSLIAKEYPRWRAKHGA